MLCLALAPPAVAEMFGPGYSPCGDKPSTAETVACVTAKTKDWDRRLNAAYKALQQRVDPGQADPLKAAQRLWLQYRTANCAFYGSGAGTIGQVQAAECMRAMTEDRTQELEKAMKLE